MNTYLDRNIHGRMYTSPYSIQINGKFEREHTFNTTNNTTLNYFNLTSRTI